MMARWTACEERWDRRAALISCVIANCSRDPRKAAYEIADFMPCEAKPNERMSEADVLATIIQLNAAMGGTIVRI